MKRLLVYVGVIIMLVVAGVVAERTRESVDLTAGNSLTLTDQTREVVDALDREVRVTAVLTPGQPGRSEAAALLSRFRRQSRHIRVRILNPDRSPGEVRRLGIDPLFGGLAIEVRSGTRARVERAGSVSEQDITAGLARILRGTTATVCVTTGHGEPAVADELGDGLSLAAGLLRDNGYRIEEVDLLVGTTVPETCRALFIVNPLSPLGAAEKAVADYLARGGKAFVATDPVSTVDLTPLLEPYGMRIERGIVLEGSTDNRLPGDPVTPVVSQYRSVSPVTRRLPPTVYAGAQGITIDTKGRPGLSTVHVARTTNNSVLDRRPEEGRFNEAEDLRGPIAIVAAADLSSNQGTFVLRTRVLATGDAEVVTNGFVSQGGNGRLLLQAMDWLTLDEDLISISANLPAFRPLSLTERRTNYMRLLTGVLVPAFFLVAGALVWAVRRSR